jgi:hypothetical protein
MLLSRNVLLQSFFSRQITLSWRKGRCTGSIISPASWLSIELALGAQRHFAQLRDIPFNVEVSIVSTVCSYFSVCSTT